MGKEKRRGGCRERQPGRNRAQRVRRGCSPAGPPVEKADFRRAGGAVGAAERRVKEVGIAAAGREKTGEGSEKTMPLLLWIFTKSKGKFCMRGKMLND